MRELELYRESSGQYSTSESMNHDASGSYVQKTDYDELRAEHYDSRANVQELLKENAELKCKIFNISKAWRLASSDISALFEAQPMNKSDGSYDIDGQSCHELYLAIDKTPTQHLSDIKADAVMGLMDNEYSCETPNGDIAFSSRAIEEYANKLRGE